MASARKLTIAIDHSGPAPIGRLLSAAGPAVGFAGWLELLEARRTAIAVLIASHELFAGAER